MRVSNIYVSNFRNLKQQTISFAPKLNVVFGKNAQGKTNLLEAIYFSTIGKSPRTHKDLDTINFGQNSANIRLNYLRGGIDHSLGINLKFGAKKAILIDDNGKVKLSDMIGKFGSVYFSPDELRLVQGSPMVRRRFVDIINCQLNRQYMVDLQNYNRLLMQRNNLLKQRSSNLISELSVWDDLLCKENAKIAQKRQQFVHTLNLYAAKIHKDLSGNSEELQILYDGICGKDEAFFDKFVEKWKERKKQNLERDIALGYTTFGVHCDDYVFLLNGLDARKNGSQGQQRTITLALKLAEMEILKGEYGEYPVLLLDDVLSELDSSRREKLLCYFSDIQCVLTCTDFDLPLDCNKLKMENGVIIDTN